jgi:hypothetical protein
MFTQIDNDMDDSPQNSPMHRDMRFNSSPRMFNSCKNIGIDDPTQILMGLYG